MPSEAINEIKSELTGAIEFDIGEMITEALQAPETRMLMNHPELKKVRGAAARGEIPDGEMNKHTLLAIKRAIGGR